MRAITTETFNQLQQQCFDAQARAEQADRLWQAALDKAGIERYSLQAKYDERVKDFYLARLQAIAAMHEAQDRLRGYLTGETRRGELLWRQ